MIRKIIKRQIFKKKNICRIIIGRKYISFFSTVKHNCKCQIRDDIYIHTSHNFFGNNIGDETLEKEYKEFRPNDIVVSTLIENKIFQSALEKGNWTIMNTYFNACIEKYISDRIPKYFVSFGNTHIKYGDLYIGVTDNGEMIGFPLTNMLRANNYSLIQRWIRSSIIKILYTTLSEKTNVIYNQIRLLYNRIIRKIKVDIIHLSYQMHTEYDDQIDQYILEYNTSKKIYDASEVEYIEKKRIWLRLINRYKQSVNVMINDMTVRSEIIDFITNIKLDIACDQIKKQIIDRLLDSTPIIFQQHQVINEMNDPKKLAYWVTMFRDAKVDQVIHNKPIYPNISRPLCPYFRMLRDMRPIIKKLIDNGIQMAVLRIRFPGRLQLEEFPILTTQYGDSIKCFYRDVDTNNKPITLF